MAGRAHRACADCPPACPLFLCSCGFIIACRLHAACRTPIQPSSFTKDQVAELGKGTPEQRVGQPKEVAPCFVFLGVLTAPALPTICQLFLAHQHTCTYACTMHAVIASYEYMTVTFERTSGDYAATSRFRLLNSKRRFILTCSI